ncbi:MAG: hypothetical protein Q8M16_05975, partial [Pirellulaceae bacterium]|nr:hypothetical protein [Pirellulaceae bacterium]
MPTFSNATSSNKAKSNTAKSDTAALTKSGQFDRNPLAVLWNGCCMFLGIAALVTFGGCSDNSDVAVDIKGTNESRFADFDRETWIVPVHGQGVRD